MACTWESSSNFTADREIYFLTTVCAHTFACSDTQTHLHSNTCAGHMCSSLPHQCPTQSHAFFLFHVPKSCHPSISITACTLALVQPCLHSACLPSLHTLPAVCWPQSGTHTGSVAQLSACYLSQKLQGRGFCSMFLCCCAGLSDQIHFKNTEPSTAPTDCFLLHQHSPLLTSAPCQHHAPALHTTCQYTDYYHLPYVS